MEGSLQTTLSACMVAVEIKLNCTRNEQTKSQLSPFLVQLFSSVVGGVSFLLLCPRECQHK